MSLGGLGQPLGLGKLGPDWWHRVVCMEQDWRGSGQVQGSCMMQAKQPLLLALMGDCLGECSRGGGAVLWGAGVPG